MGSVAGKSVVVPSCGGSHPQETEMKRIALIATALAGLLAAGCAGPSPSPAPTGPVATGPAMPSAAATPTLCPGTPGSAPTPCTAAQVEELAAKAALYLEAEQVYRRFFEEDGKVAMAGAAASDAVLALMTGPFRDSYLTERHRLIGTTASGYGQVAYVHPAPGQSYEGSDVAISACEDGSHSVVYRNGQELGRLGSRQSIYYLKRTDGALRIWWQKSTKVTSC